MTQTRSSQTSTRPYFPRVAGIFDFDKTLAGDSIDALVGVLGLTRDEWSERYLHPLGDGWDTILQRGHALIRAADDVGRPLTQEVFDEAADAIDLFPGVLEMPSRLQSVASETHPGTNFEFAILSSGFVELIAPTRIGKRADYIRGGAFHFEDGRAVAVKRSVSHPDKALYLRAYAEGKTMETVNAPGTSGDVVPESEMHMRYDQMVYVGDGDSDLEAFGFLEARGGLTIAIEDGARFDSAEQQTADQRVQTLAGSDYGEGSDLLNALEAAVRASAARIALRAVRRA